MPSSISSGATSAQKQTDLTSWVPKQFVARVHISSTAGDDEEGHAAAAGRPPQSVHSHVEDSVRVCVCVGGLLQTDPPERAKTATASSGCRPRPTAPDPGLSHGNSQEQATLGPTNAGEATGTPASTEARILIFSTKGKPKTGS